MGDGVGWREGWEFIGKGVAIICNGERRDYPFTYGSQDSDMEAGLLNGSYLLTFKSVCG
jgi:hypothetical protein